MNSADFAVIGAGVLGVNVAVELKRRHPDASVVLLEKEAQPGLHASGRNSGVLHAGFYYTADSLKARFTRQGNERMKQYVEAKGLRINRCGKLVVARNEQELEGLEELLRRGRLNGVTLEELDEAQARAIEPRIKVLRKALFSPNTATVDPATRRPLRRSPTSALKSPGLTARSQLPTFPLPFPPSRLATAPVWFPAPRACGRRRRRDSKWSNSPPGFRIQGSSAPRPMAISSWPKAKRARS